MSVTGLSVPISQFQNDSTQFSLGTAVLFTKRWPLQSAQSVSSAPACIRPRADLAFCMMEYLRTALAQLPISRDTLQALDGSSGFHSPVTSWIAAPIVTSTRECRGTKSHSDLAARSPRGLQFNPYSKQGKHKTQPWAIMLTDVSKNEDPTPSRVPLFQGWNTVIVKRFLLIFNQFLFLQLVSIVVLPLWTVSIFSTVPTKNVAPIDFHLVLFLNSLALGPKGYWSAILPATYSTKYWHGTAETL